MRVRSSDVDGARKYWVAMRQLVSSMPPAERAHFMGYSHALSLLGVITFLEWASLQELVR